MVLAEHLVDHVIHLTDLGSSWLVSVATTPAGPPGTFDVPPSQFNLRPNSPPSSHSPPPQAPPNPTTPKRKRGASSDTRNSDRARELPAEPHRTAAKRRQAVAPTVRSAEQPRPYPLRAEGPAARRQWYECNSTETASLPPSPNQQPPRTFTTPPPARAASEGPPASSHTKNPPHDPSTADRAWLGSTAGRPQQTRGRVAGAGLSAAKEAPEACLAAGFPTTSQTRGIDVTEGNRQSEARRPSCRIPVRPKFCHTDTL